MAMKVLALALMVVPSTSSSSSAMVHAAGPLAGDWKLANVGYLVSP